MNTGAPSALSEDAAPTELFLLVGVAFLLAVAVLIAALAMQNFVPSMGQYQVVMGGTLGVALVGMLCAYGALRHSRLGAAANKSAAQRLTKFHAAMSQTNRLIIRRPNPFELLEGVCQTFVNTGGIDLAVVDLSDVGEAHRATAAVPLDRFVSMSPQVLLDGARLQALMMAMTLQTGTCVVVDDVLQDERLSGARAWCLANGLNSLAAVPLQRGDDLVGVVLLCSREAGFFGGEVMPLMSELGADISFALDNVDRERERQGAIVSERARVTAQEANLAKTEFLAQMSHELRTPLNAMLGFTQLLASDNEQALTNLQAERVRLIAHAGWHLLGLVNDVMDISRIESRHFEVHNVCGDISFVLDEAVALTQPLARKNNVELAEQQPTKFGIGAVADPRRLLQVLLNLLSNAIKFNRPGGRVRVEVTHLETEVMLDVIDNGIGMTEENLSHLFEPFNRLGNAGNAIEGSGIGLSLTRHLVEMMEGRLEIESSPEFGTRARLVLPGCAVPLKPVAQTAEEAVPRTHRDTASGIVLYIEDDPINQILVEDMLARCEGIYLIQARNGADGIAQARLEQPDLVLLDMHLGDMTGFDVLKALRSDPLTMALRVVVVSANVIEADVVKAFDLGALEYWSKPLKLQEFVEGVSTLLLKNPVI